MEVKSMSLYDAVFFTPSDLFAREGALLEDLPIIDRHDLVIEILADKLSKRFPEIDDPAAKVKNPKIFREAAINLNLSLVLRENSSYPDDIYAVRAEFYHRRFLDELEQALEVVQFEGEDVGVEFQR